MMALPDTLNDREHRKFREVGGKTTVATTQANPIDEDPLIADALNRISNIYGDTVSVNNKAKMLLKFGSADIQSANTWTTIWNTAQDQDNETYVERNLINGISSSSTSDTGIGYVVTVEGHTVGSDQSVSSITQTGGTATVTTGSAHGYAVNQYVNIQGASQAGYNGIRKVLTVPTTTTFTYEVASGTASPATGTITTNHLNKTFVSQNAQLNGQNEVTLSTPLARCTRTFIGPQNNAQDLNGSVYVYESTALTAGKPNDTTKIHLSAPAYSVNISNNSQKASTSLSSSDYWLVTSYHAGLQERTANLFASVKMQYRPLGDGWRDVDDPIVLNSGNSKAYNFKPYENIPKNADIRLLAIASASCKISGGIDGFLAN